MLKITNTVILPKAKNVNQATNQAQTLFFLLKENLFYSDDCILNALEKKRIKLPAKYKKSMTTWLSDAIEFIDEYFIKNEQFHKSAVESILCSIIGKSNRDICIDRLSKVNNDFCLITVFKGALSNIGIFSSTNYKTGCPISTHMCLKNLNDNYIEEVMKHEPVLVKKAINHIMFIHGDAETAKEMLSAAGLHFYDALLFNNECNRNEVNKLSKLPRDSIKAILKLAIEHSKTFNIHPGLKTLQASSAINWLSTCVLLGFPELAKTFKNLGVAHIGKSGFAANHAFTYDHIPAAFNYTSCPSLNVFLNENEITGPEYKIDSYLIVDFDYFSEKINTELSHGADCAHNAILSYHEAEKYKELGIKKVIQEHKLRKAKYAI